MLFSLDLIIFWATKYTTGTRFIQYPLQVTSILRPFALVRCLAALCGFCVFTVLSGRLLSFAALLRALSPSVPLPSCCTSPVCAVPYKTS